MQEDPCNLLGVAPRMSTKLRCSPPRYTLLRGNSQHNAHKSAIVRLVSIKSVRAMSSHMRMHRRVLKPFIGLPSKLVLVST